MVVIDAGEVRSSAFSSVFDVLSRKGNGSLDARLV
jgi:hypothetical protein